MKKRMRQEKQELDQELDRPIGWSTWFFCQSEIFQPNSLADSSSACVSHLHLISQQFWFLLSAHLAPAQHSQDREIPHLPLGTGSSAQSCDGQLVAVHLLLQQKQKVMRKDKKLQPERTDFTSKRKKKMCLFEESNLKSIQKVLELQAIWCCFVPYSISVLAVQNVSLFFIYNYF